MVPGTLPEDRTEREASLARMVGDLVRIPSRAGVDAPDPMFASLGDWLASRGVRSSVLRTGERPVGIAGRAGRPGDGAAYVLNATVDTAGFGDTGRWSLDPTSGKVEDGWLHGRGSADSKAGIAIFCHLLADWQAGGRDELGFIFDADEHTGGFAGITGYLDQCRETVAGVLIGYPGCDRVLAGARGFWRTTLSVHGNATHSGSSRNNGANAVYRAAELALLLRQAGGALGELPRGDFGLPPKLTVTGIRGGGAFSELPGLCEIGVDVRLTALFGAGEADTLVRRVASEFDGAAPCLPPTTPGPVATWPAYRLPADSGLAAILAGAAAEVFGRPMPVGIAGPSNVGNLLAARGVPATCGFGVGYRNIHAPDECVDLATLEPVCRAYGLALERLQGD